jgi:hypothetical protein
VEIEETEIEETEGTEATVRLTEQRRKRRQNGNRRGSNELLAAHDPPNPPCSVFASVVFVAP